MMKKRLRRAPGWVAAGGRVYAVGDVHGCAGRLAALHEGIADDLRCNPAERPIVIHLGDYVDRGRESAAVIRRLARGPVIPGVRTVNLRGNHEQMMLDALTGDPERVDHWLRNGGEATLQSFGTSSRTSAEVWRAALGQQDEAFLGALPLHHRVDGYVFVHAGVRPGVNLAHQAEDDLLWIRQGFLDWCQPYWPASPDVAVVHGHTPETHPVVASNRIGIDTGAVREGALTCAVLEGETVRFLTA